MVDTARARTAIISGFELPLVLQGGGADHKDAFHAEEFGHNLDGGDRLNGLAQPHFVADQAAARAGGE
jgi:hypothetical protein